MYFRNSKIRAKYIKTYFFKHNSSFVDLKQAFDKKKK